MAMWTPRPGTMVMAESGRLRPDSWMSCSSQKTLPSTGAWAMPACAGRLTDWKAFGRNSTATCLA